jgi:hypothetical protein
VEALEERLLFCADNAGHSLADAQPIALDPRDSGVQAGCLDTTGELDVYKIVATLSGPRTIRMDADLGSLLDSFLTVYDAQGRVIASNDNDPLVAGTLNSVVTVDLTVGQVYYIRASGVAQSPTDSTGATGDYHLAIDDFGGDADTPGTSAFPDTFAGPGPFTLSQPGTIELGEDVDAFQVVAPATGTLQVTLAADPGAALQPQLEVDDGQGNPILTGQAPSGSGAVRLGLTIAGGSTYVFKVSSETLSPGGYTLGMTLTPLAQKGHDFASAQVVSVAAAGPATETSSIDTASQADFYRFVAPATGAIVIQQQAAPGSRLDSLLTVFDDSQAQIARNDDSGGTTSGPNRDSTLLVPVVRGRTYFVEAAGFQAATGLYTLTLSYTGGGYDLATARPLTVPDAGTLTTPGSIDAPGQADFYKFTAPTTGGVTIVQRETGPDASKLNFLDSFLTVYDQAGNVVDFNDDAGVGVTADPKDSRVRFNAVAGRTYYVRAAAFPNSSGISAFGPYALDISTGPVFGPDEVATPTAAAAPIDLQTGWARVSAAIPTATFAALYRVEAPRDGSILVQLDPGGPGSILQGYLYVFDDQGHQLATDDDASLLYGRQNDAVQFDVRRGGVYFVRVAAFRFRDPRAGQDNSYDLTLSTSATPVSDLRDGFPATFPAAPNLILDASGSATQPGFLGFPGDVNVFRFVATTTGTLILGESAAPGSRLDSALFAFDDSGSLLAFNDDAGNGTRDSRFTLPVVAGKTYFVKATGFGPSTGGFLLSISPPTDDYIDTFTTTDPVADANRTITLAAPDPLGVLASKSGAINFSGDVDMFKFVATITGRVAVSQAQDGSGLDSFLTAYDGNQVLIASNDDSNGTRDSLIQFNVEQGQVYYLAAAGFGASTGGYKLTIALGGGDNGVGHSLVSATPVGLPLDQSGRLQAPGDSDFYRFTASQSGTITARLDAAPNGAADPVLDGFLFVYDASGNEVASDDDGGGGLNSLSRFAVQAGQTYFLRAAGFGTSIGAYHLTAAFDATGGPATGSAVTSLGTVKQDISINSKLLTANVFGVLATPTSADIYRFVAPYTGPLAIRQEWTEGSLLDSYLFFFDDSQRLIASDDDNGLGNSPDSLVIANVVAGQTYFLRTASSSNRLGPDRKSTGAYRLSIGPLSNAFGNTFADARTVLPDGTPQASQIHAPGDTDFYQFRAVADGRLTIKAKADGPLIPLVIVYDQNHTEIARGLDGAVQIDALQGQLDFIQVAGLGSSTGSYQLTVQPSGQSGPIGPDFGSASPLILPATGTAVVSGTIATAADQNVFQFKAPATGRITVRLTPGPGGALVGQLAAFATINGALTQIASDLATPGILGFDATASQVDFLLVTPAGGTSGSYRLAIGEAAAAPAPPTPATAAKQTLDQLRQSVVGMVTQGGLDPDKSQTVADAISADLVRQFLASLDGQPLTTDYLLVWSDPVDPLVTDPLSRRVGYSSAIGSVSEVPGAYNSGAGALKLLLAPESNSGIFRLQLSGLGLDPVLFGARYISRDGQVFAPQSEAGGELPVRLGLSIDTVVMLDFRPEGPPVPGEGSGANSGSEVTGDPASSSTPDAPSAALSTLAAVPLLAQSSPAAAARSPGAAVADPPAAASGGGALPNQPATGDASASAPAPSSEQESEPETALGAAIEGAVQKLREILKNPKNPIINVLRNLLIRSSSWLFPKSGPKPGPTVARPAVPPAPGLAGKLARAAVPRLPGSTVVARHPGPPPATIPAPGARRAGPRDAAPRAQAAASPRARLASDRDTRPVGARHGAASILVSMAGFVALEAVRAPWVGVATKPRPRASRRGPLRTDRDPSGPDR